MTDVSSDCLEETRCGVVIVAYRSDRLLASMLGEHPWLRSPRTVIIDNSENEPDRRATREVVRGTSVTLIGSGGNVGFGSASNRGMALLASRGYEYGLLLNPDAGLSQTDLQALVSLAREQPTALIAPRIVTTDGRPWFEGGRLNQRTGFAEHAPGARDWLTAACLLVPLAHWRVVGGFNEALFLYWEDVDLSWRWARSGGTLVLADHVTAVHEVGGTQGHGPGKSHTYLRYMCRNRMIFAGTHLRLSDFLRWACWSLVYARRMFGRRPRLARGGSSMAATRAVLGGTFAGTLVGIQALTRRGRT